MHNINDFEKKALDALLRGNHPALEVFRTQIKLLSVSKREFTGVGFFTHFNIVDYVSKINSKERIIIDDVAGEIEGLESGCGFVLFIEKGILDCLECYTFGDEKFPNSFKIKRLYYLGSENSEERNIEELKLKNT